MGKITTKEIRKVKWKDKEEKKAMKIANMMIITKQVAHE
jgi:hypothetical protein